jgi:hypothetical protein
MRDDESGQYRGPVAPPRVCETHAFARVARGLSLAASGVVRWMLLALVVSGCGFTIDGGPAVVGGDDGPQVDEPDGGGNTTPARMCSTSDPALKLCIDFDDPANLATDQFQHPLQAQNLMPDTRDTEKAVALDDESRLHVLESPDFDITDAVTVSMWIKIDIGGLPVGPTSSRWLFDNNTQYYGSLREGGVVRCGSGATLRADSAPISLNQWHHITCTYDRREIRVYVDGQVGGCDTFSDRSLPTGGHEGLAIGANISGGAGGPYFTEELESGIDNVQLFARALDPTEVCTAARETGCVATCP